MLRLAWILKIDDGMFGSNKILLAILSVLSLSLKLCLTLARLWKLLEFGGLWKLLGFGGFWALCRNCYFFLYIFVWTLRLFE